jgi:branched-chain amino acid transport system substrate-binding protein
MQTRRSFLESLAAAGTLVIVGRVEAQTQETIKIGFLVPMTGQLAIAGNEMVAATKLFVEQNGTNVAGKKIELTIRDDASVPDQAKRVARELVVNSKVAVLAGCLSTPVALAIASISTQAKIPQIVMGAGTSIITERSPYIVRTFATQAQQCAPMAWWAAKNGIRNVVTLVSDYAPGYESEKSFADEFKASGGEILESLRVPSLSPDFAPYLQRVRDTKPDALFVWFPGSSSIVFWRQYMERGLHTSGIKLIGPGEVVDDETLDQMNDSMLDVITTFQYSVAHPSETNKAFVEGMKRFNNGTRPNHMAVAAYDGMHLIYEALKKTGGSSDGDALIAAMKGMAWQSPRGPILIDPETRDIVQNIYVRRLQRLNGELYNVEFDKFEAVKDPIKAAQRT